MMDMTKFFGILDHLTMVELQQAHTKIGAMIGARAIPVAMPAALPTPVPCAVGLDDFRIGDVVEFNYRGRWVQFRIKRINLSSISGRSLDGTTRCRATPALCRKVAPAPARTPAMPAVRAPMGEGAASSAPGAGGW